MRTFHIDILRKLAQQKTGYSSAFSALDHNCRLLLNFLFATSTTRLRPNSRLQRALAATITFCAQAFRHSFPAFFRAARL
jgi:hypothetical protein